MLALKLDLTTVVPLGTDFELNIEPKVQAKVHVQEAYGTTLIFNVPAYHNVVRFECILLL